MELITPYKFLARECKACSLSASAAPESTSSGKPIFPQKGVTIGPGLTVLMQAYKWFDRIKKQFPNLLNH